MSSVLDYVLVCCPDVAVFPKRPWPSVKVDGLVVYGVGRGDGGLVIYGYVGGKWCESSDKGSCDLCSSWSDRFTIEAAVELKASVGGLVVLSDKAFLDCDGCMRGSFDVPCAECAQAVEWVIAAYHGSVGDDIWCCWGVFVYGCHVHML